MQKKGFRCSLSTFYAAPLCFPHLHDQQKVMKKKAITNILTVLTLQLADSYLLKKRPVEIFSKKCNFKLKFGQKIL